MTRDESRLAHPARGGGRGSLGSAARPSPELLYASVREAYEDLEHALESHDQLAATAAAFEWWAALGRLRGES